MNTEQILMCVVALILGMLLANMLKSVCGCKVVEGQSCDGCPGDTPDYCSSGNIFESSSLACLDRIRCFRDHGCESEPWMTYGY